MRTRGNQTAKKRLSRKQTKKYGLRELMFGGLSPSEHSASATSKSKTSGMSKDMLLDKITQIKRRKINKRHI
jgi:hypothetical protein